MLHGDCTAAKVLVRDGRVVALLDFEWSRRGPRDIEVTLPAFSAWADGPAMLPWRAEFYPELFEVPGFEQRQWFYRVGATSTSISTRLSGKHIRGKAHYRTFDHQPQAYK
jgi:aminoglycoside phosphotransferase (APT) family kinase protein